MLNLPKPERLVKISYTNWRGETADRIIAPYYLTYGATEWHKEPQHLLTAYDMDKGELRKFAMKDIHSWEPYH